MKTTLSATKKIMLSICSLFLFWGAIWAQNINVTGKVTDRSGAPLPGISVMVKETRTFVPTDLDGNYRVNVPSNAVLVFSSIGMITVEQPVNGRAIINVVLEEDATLLTSAVVVGFGTQKRESLTGAVASVNVDKTLQSRPIADVGRGLQGAVPGLTIRVQSGEIGSDPSIRIRGHVGSVNGSSVPLILLDNVEIPSIQIVNPDDIESISVLKDAASSAIYGAKAAFGVLLINTKRGAKKESVTVTYSNNFSWQNRAKELVMGQVDGMQYAWDAAVTRNPEALAPPTASGNMWRINQESINKAREWADRWGGIVKPDDPFVYGRDWIFDGTNKFGYRTFSAVDALVANWTPTSSHNLSLSGLSGNTSYSMGIGLIDQSGMIKPAKIDDFKRYNVSLSVSTQVNKYVSVRGNVIYSDRIKRYPTVGSPSADPWYYAYRWGPTSPVGVVDQFGRDLRGPSYEFANTTTGKLRNVYTSLTMGTTINVTKNWDIKFDYTHVTREDITESSIPMFTAMDVWYNPGTWNDESGNPVYVNDAGQIVPQGTDGSMRGYKFSPVTYPSNAAYGLTSSILRQSVATNSNAYNAYSTYNLDLDAHAIKLTLGMNAVANDSQRHQARQLDLTNYDNPQFAFATGVMDVTGSASWDSEFGVFGRLNYTYSDKYLLEGTLRYAGSSKFPKHLKWQYFPAVSGGWVISNESFMQGLKPILSMAKLRVSWGQLGDASVSNSMYIPTMTGYNTDWIGDDGLRQPSYRSPSIVSSDIKWQTIETLDFGFEARFWSNRFGVEFDWYRRDTKDMIIAGDALPMTLGAGVPNGNYGNLRTNGFELSLDFNHRFKNGLGINVLATLFDAVTRTTKGADWQIPWEERSIGSTYATGARYGDIWGYVTDRLYQEEDFVKDPTNPRGLKKVTIIIDGTARQSYMLVGPNPVYQTRLEGGDGVQIFRPGDVKFVDLNGDGYITPGRGQFGDPGDRKVIGNSTPRYEYGFRLGADYKGFDFLIFIQGIGSRQIWGDGQLAIPGYYTGDGAIAQEFAGNYWRPDRTDAFYPRPWDCGQSTTSYSLQVQTRYLLNMAYTRIKTISFGYAVPTKLLDKVLIKKARVYASLENFFTFDHLRGMPIDPEVVSGYSMFSTNYNLSRTGMGTPNFKSASVGLQVSF